MSVSKEDEKIIKKIGIQIGKRRTELDKTQGEIAEDLDIDRGNYTKMENGNRERRFSFSQLVTLSEKLNTSLDYIFGLTDEATPNIDLKNFCNEYGLKESTLNTIKNIKELNNDSIECVNDFINGQYISPYFFEDIYKFTIYKKIAKNIILFSRFFDFGDLISYYHKEKNYTELNKIFNYFDTFLIALDNYSKLFITEFFLADFHYDFKALQIYTCTETDFENIFNRFKLYTKIEDFRNEKDTETMALYMSLYMFLSSRYGNTSTPTNIDISNYLLYMKDSCVRQLENLHKEIAYNKYNISSILDSYLNKIEDFTYFGDVEKLSNEDKFIKSLINKQNKMKGDEKKNGNKRKRKE